MAFFNNKVKATILFVGIICALYSTRRLRPARRRGDGGFTSDFGGGTGLVTGGYGPLRSGTGQHSGLQWRFDPERSDRLGDIIEVSDTGFLEGGMTMQEYADQ